MRPSFGSGVHAYAHSTARGLTFAPRGAVGASMRLFLFAPSTCTACRLTCRALAHEDVDAAWRDATRVLKEPNASSMKQGRSGFAAKRPATRTQTPADATCSKQLEL